MSEAVRPVKGMRDLFGAEARNFRRIVNLAAETASSFGFQYIETPILESASVFLRSLGDTSDIVSKEMYRFTDAGGDDLVLRPEGTAPIARAFLSLGLTHSTPLKVFYSGPMFRRERPQKGRYRQFYQFGLEILGSDTPLADVEAIDIGFQILKKLNVADKVTLRLNTLGDQASRDAYRDSLLSYLRSKSNQLSSDSLARLEKNPLRILDSKDPQDQELLKGAPTLKGSLTASAQQFFDQVTRGLQALGIPFTLDDRLVRGLDYYNHTVFEFTTEHLGAQNAVLAGGRYNGLIEEMGGPATPSVGWAFGVDRLHLLCEDAPSVQKRIALIPASEAQHWSLYRLAQALTCPELSFETTYSGAIGKRLSKAAKAKLDYALILGEEEERKQVVVVKDLGSGEQKEFSIQELESLQKHLAANTQNPK